MVYTHDAYHPYAVALEVTLACNMRCLHCGSYATGQNRSKPLSLDEWKGVIDDLKRLKTEVITLSGGEPFVYKHWRELIKYIRKAPKAQVSLISNGYTVTEADVIFMKKMGVSHVGFSLDGDEKTHDYIRQTPGAFQRLMHTIYLCQKHDFKFSIVSSINKINYGVREKILDVMLKNKIKYWQVQIVNSFGRAGELQDQMLLSHQQYTQLVEDIATWQEKYSHRVRIMPADSIGYCHPVTDHMLGESEWQGCNAGLYVIGIEANGNVKGCLSLQDDRFRAGNVRERSLIEIWNDDSCFAYTRLYDETKMQGSCQGCDTAGQCKAGCLGMAYSVHGSIHENSYCYKKIKEKEKSVIKAA
ncbi:MAG: radical SAM protein [bacterium]|nr:radical SAM protein [bacterium]MBU1916557.1 radical SAM protein [bacterium]